MTRRPSHCECPGLPENATAQTVPSLATSVPHMLKPRPPLAPAAGVMALMSAERSCEKFGRAEQSAKAGPATTITRALIEHESIRCWTFIVLLLWCDGRWDDKQAQVPSFLRGKPSDALLFPRHSPGMKIMSATAENTERTRTSALAAQRDLFLRRLREPRLPRGGLALGRQRQCRALFHQGVHTVAM